MSLNINEKTHEDTVNKITNKVGHQIENFLYKGYQGIIILGIGSNNKKYVNFDTYGPRVGSLLKQYNLPKFVDCYGTMEEPLNAINIEKFAEEKKTEFSKNIVIAIDACVTMFTSNLGKIKVCNFGVQPGAGFKKDIDIIGDFSIIATTIKKGNFFSTDLKDATVINESGLELLANITAEALYKGLSKEDTMISRQRILRK